MVINNKFFNNTCTLFIAINNSVERTVTLWCVTIGKLWPQMDQRLDEST